MEFKQAGGPEQVRLSTSMDKYVSSLMLAEIGRLEEHVRPLRESEVVRSALHDGRLGRVMADPIIAADVDVDLDAGAPALPAMLAAALPPSCVATIAAVLTSRNGPQA